MGAARRSGHRAKALEEFFGQDASQLELEHETRGQVYGFAWLSPQSAQGLRERYSVDIDRLGVSSLRDYPKLPPAYSFDLFPFGEVTMNEWGLPVAVVVSILVSALGFFNRRRVAQAAPWRTAIAAVSFVAAAGLAYDTISRPEGIGIDVAVAVALGLLYAVVVFLSSITLEVLVKKQRIWKLGTLIALFTQRTGKEAPGLSLSAALPSDWSSSERTRVRSGSGRRISERGSRPFTSGCSAV